jgi:hypothetical protein
MKKQVLTAIAAVSAFACLSGCTQVAEYVFGPFDRSIDDTPPALSGYSACQASVNGKIYYFGGMDASGAYGADVWIYEVESAEWTHQAGVLPYAYFSKTGVPAAFLASAGKFYLSPGLGPTKNSGYGSHSRIVEYDPARGTAKETSQLFAGNSWDCLPLAGRGSYADWVFFYGGSDGTNLDSIKKYNPVTGEVYAVSALPSPSSQLSGIRFEDGLHLILDAANDRLYTFDSSCWSLVSSCADPRAAGKAAAMWYGAGGKAYFAYPSSDRAYRYDREADTVEECAESFSLGSRDSLFLPVYDLGSSKFFILGGRDSSGATVDAFDEAVAP